jgi:phenylacetate-CoA ligase
MTTHRTQRSTLLQRQQFQQLDLRSRESYQLQRFNQMLEAILPINQFYRNKLDLEGGALASLAELAGFPFTFKNELLGEAATGGFAANRTWPIENYTRFHRTSGTRGRPLAVLDTSDDWQWWLETWQPVLDRVELNAGDRVVMAFSFGPFIGFWSAFDAALERGCLVAPAGAMKTIARLELIRDLRASIIFCTPSYALHLAEVAREHQINVAEYPVRAIVVAGEPGGSIPALRGQIAEAWQAEVVDHAGASEIGPWGFPDRQGEGVFVNEAELIPEFLSLETGAPAAKGELAELVLTTLGRYGSPVIRYRTGDIVRPVESPDPHCRFSFLHGGVLGRVDDMMIIRGVNVFPSSVEQILRGFPEIVEYRITVYRESALDQLKVEIEDRLQNPERVKQELQIRIGLRVEVECVPLGSLPRFEGKGKRFNDLRQQGNGPNV